MGTTETTQKKNASGYKLRPLELFEWSYCHDCQRKEACILEHKQMCVTLALVAALDVKRKK